MHSHVCIKRVTNGGRVKCVYKINGKFRYIFLHIKCKYRD